jgi:hypothetical protein
MGAGGWENRLLWLLTTANPLEDNAIKKKRFITK